MASTFLHDSINLVAYLDKPITTTNNTLNSSFNADLLDGKHANQLYATYWINNDSGTTYISGPKTNSTNNTSYSYYSTCTYTTSNGLTTTKRMQIGAGIESTYMKPGLQISYSSNLSSDGPFIVLSGVKSILNGYDYSSTSTTNAYTMTHLIACGTYMPVTNVSLSTLNTYKSAKLYIEWYKNTKISWLELGNILSSLNNSSTNKYGFEGRIKLYHAGTTYYTALLNDTLSRTISLYLPNPDANASAGYKYKLACGIVSTSAGVGNSTTPIYMDNYGVLKACTLGSSGISWNSTGNDIYIGGIEIYDTSTDSSCYYYNYAKLSNISGSSPNNSSFTQLTMILGATSQNEAGVIELYGDYENSIKIGAFIGEHSPNSTNYAIYGHTVNTNTYNCILSFNNSNVHPYDYCTVLDFTTRSNSHHQEIKYNLCSSTASGCTNNRTLCWLDYPLFDTTLTGSLKQGIRYQRHAVLSVNYDGLEGRIAQSWDNIGGVATCNVSGLNNLIDSVSFSRTSQTWATLNKLINAVTSPNIIPVYVNEGEIIPCPGTTYRLAGHPYDLRILWSGTLVKRYGTYDSEVTWYVETDSNGGLLNTSSSYITTNTNRGIEIIFISPYESIIEANIYGNTTNTYDFNENEYSHFSNICVISTHANITEILGSTLTKGSNPVYVNPDTTLSTSTCETFIKSKYVYDANHPNKVTVQIHTGYHSSSSSELTWQTMKNTSIGSVGKFNLTIIGYILNIF